MDASPTMPTPEPQPVPPAAEAATGTAPPSATARRITWLHWVSGATALVLVLCAVGLIVIWRLGLLPFFTGAMAAPRIMPQDIKSFATIRMDIQNTAGYHHLYDAYAQVPAVQGPIHEGLTALAESGINFDQDIRPWLGSEMAMAMTGTEVMPVLQEYLFGSSSTSSQFVLAVATRDTRASDSFLAKVRSLFTEKGAAVERKDIGGATFYVKGRQGEHDLPLIFGTVGGFVLLGTDENLVRGVVETAQGRAPSLADRASYQRIMAALPANAAVYYVVPDVQQVLESSKGVLGQIVTTATLGHNEAIQGAGVAFVLGEDGVQVDIVGAFDREALSSEALAGLRNARGQDRLLERVPADALGFVSAYDLAGTWSRWMAQLNPEATRQFADIGAEIGWPIDGHLLSWASGEYVLVLLQTDGAISQVPVGAFLLLEVSDRAKAERTLAALADFWEIDADARFEPQEVGAVPMQVLRTQPDSAIGLGCGFDPQGNLLIAFSEKALQEGLGLAVRPITEDPSYRRVRAHLPQGRGCFYLNVEAIWRMAHKSMSSSSQADFDESAWPLLEPIQAAGFASHPFDVARGISKSTLFLYVP